MKIMTQVCIAGSLAVACAGPGFAGEGTRDNGATPDTLAVLTEYGVTLALSGEYEDAERIFIDLLVHSPGDGRALNNLGNIHLLRGAPDLALAFYRRAQEADSTDIGIRLNRSIAFMRMGNTESALSEAALAIGEAGGLRSAAALLGLRYDEPESKASEPEADASLSKSQIRALLEEAAVAVPRAGEPDAPSDSTEVQDGRETKDTRKRTWRSAGPRASDHVEIMLNLYWKL
jgi:tetratricopeptide (TPR) repeat protein